MPPYNTQITTIILESRSEVLELYNKQFQLFIEWNLLDYPSIDKKVITKIFKVKIDEDQVCIND
jgi:hypothetical protein